MNKPISVFIRHRSLLLAALMISAHPAILCASNPPPPPPEAKPAAPRVLRVVYFTPADREPYADYHDRVSRIMRDIQDFYRQGMDRNGWGPRTFKLEDGADGRVVLHEVKGAHPADFYTLDHGYDMRAEVQRALAAQNIDINQETIVIFAAVLHFDPLPDGRIRITGDCPYYGSGSTFSGTGWFNDDPGMDINRLRDKEPTMIYKNADMPRGRLNSVLIGGIAHELGHALGLPHIKETQADQRSKRGTALMGAGNYTYREEVRNEGPGSFLTAAESAMLACHPLFARESTALPRELKGTLERFVLRYDAQDRSLKAEGVWRRNVPAHSVVVLNDEWGTGPKNEHDDYDAVGWTARMETNGFFRIRIGELRPGSFELRLVLCHENGVNAIIPFRYETNAAGVPDISHIQSAMAYIQLCRLFSTEDLPALNALFQRNDPAELPGETRSALGEWLAARDGSRKYPLLADTPADTRRVMLSDMEWDEGKVGWIRPAHNSVPDPQLPLIAIGNRFYRYGLYAHAPARHVYSPKGQWKQFTAEGGVQVAKLGRVVFVVRGDDRELFRTSPVGGQDVVPVKVDVSGVQRLELIVEDAGDTNRGDWGVWLNPALER